MEDTSEGSTSSKLNSANVKPVVVRVKRKAFQSPLEAFWLEINERPLKRPLLDFAKLSISDSTEKVSEELKAKKIFVQHVETVSSSDATIDILQSFVDPNSADASKFRLKIDERKRTFKESNRKNQQLVRSRQNHELLSKNARFEQIWKKRRGNEESSDNGSLHKICHLYDVVRVDGEEKSNKGVEPEDTSLEDCTILSDYLPLLREFLPSVAEEIQSGIQSHLSQQDSAGTDSYVYDLYAVQSELSTTDEDALNLYPLVQVDDDDDFYDGPIQSDYETDDSNAEDNPLNDYPDESSEDESDDANDDDDVDEDKPDKDEDEDESITSSNPFDELDDERYYHDFEDGDSLFDREEIDVDDDYDEVADDDHRYEFR